MIPVVQHVPVETPLELSREQARRLAELELADPAYRAAQPGLIERVIRWLVDWVQDVIDRASQAAPGGWLGILGLVLLIALAVLFVRWRIGPASRDAGVTFTVDPATTAAQYRAHAAELAAAGQWDAAISERMRAVVRGCQERGLIDGHPGWTAHEVTDVVSRLVPDAAESLRAAARSFEAVRYGGRPGSQADYDAICDADDRVTLGGVRAVSAASTGPRPGQAQRPERGGAL